MLSFYITWIYLAQRRLKSRDVTLHYLNVLGRRKEFTYMGCLLYVTSCTGIIGKYVALLYRNGSI